MILRNISAVIDRILSKKIYFSYKDVTYYYLFPSSDLRLQSSLVYEDCYDGVKYDNLIKEDIDFYLQDYDIADASLKKFLEGKYKQLDNTKIDLYENFYKTKENANIRRKLKTLRHTISETEKQLHYLDSLTAEYQCAQRQNEFLFLNGIYDKNHKLVFNYNNINTIDEHTFNQMISVINTKLLNSTDFRYIARSAEWHSIWNIKNHRIFDDAVVEWSEEQKSLIAFSQMYDNIYQHMECPDDKIIEDDDALDGWSLYQKRKLEQEKKKKGVSSINDRHKNASEIFMVANNAEEFDHIMSLNDNEASNRMKQKFDYLNANKGKVVREDQLPDVRQDIRDQYAKMAQK